MPLNITPSLHLPHTNSPTLFSTNSCAEEILHAIDLAAAQVLAITNTLGQVEFLATALYLLNESNAGSLQLKDSSCAERVRYYNSTYGEVFHEAGQYGDCVEPREKIKTRFSFLSRRPPTPAKVDDALTILQPTLSTVMQSNVSLTNKVKKMWGKMHLYRREVA